MKDAVIVSAVRTPVGKAKRGGLATVRPDEMSAATVQLLKRTPIRSRPDEDVYRLRVPEGEQGSNMARMIALRAGLPDSVPGETINRYCSSGVQSIAHVAYAIQSGQIEIGIAGSIHDDGLMADSSSRRIRTSRKSRRFTTPIWDLLLRMFLSNITSTAKTKMQARLRDRIRRLR